MLDVTRQTVSRWESGKSYPSIPQIAGICRTFHIDANELLDCGENAAAQSEKPTQNEQKKKPTKTFIAAVTICGVLLAAAIGGLIAISRLYQTVFGSYWDMISCILSGDMVALSLSVNS